jgi:hypothetical protein
MNLGHTLCFSPRRLIFADKLRSTSQLRSRYPLEDSLVHPPVEAIHLIILYEMLNPLQLNKGCVGQDHGFSNLLLITQHPSR